MAKKQAAWAWKNGELVPLLEVAESAMFGTQNFELCALEGIRCYQNEKTGSSYVFRLRDHMHRFLQDCKDASIDIPYSVDELCDAVLKLICANKLPSCFVRPFAYRSNGLTGINPKGSFIDVIIVCWHYDMPLETASFEAGKAINMAIWRQSSSVSVPKDVKSDVSYPDRALARIDVLEHGYDGLIVVSEDGIIREEPGESLFVVRGGDLYVSPLPEGVPESIMRDTLMRIAGNMKIAVNEKELCPVDLCVADEVFMTGPVVGIMAIGSIDGCVIGGVKSEGKGRSIVERFSKIARGKLPQYKSWRTEITFPA